MSSWNVTIQDMMKKGDELRQSVKEILSEENASIEKEVLNRLPLFFCRKDGKKPTRESLERFVEVVRDQVIKEREEKRSNSGI